MLRSKNFLYWNKERVKNIHGGHQRSVLMAQPQIETNHPIGKKPTIILFSPHCCPPQRDLPAQKMPILQKALKIRSVSLSEGAAPPDSWESEGFELS